MNASTSFLIGSALASLLQISPASAENFDGAYPFIAPGDCGYLVRNPGEASGAYRSKDCSSVFILPPAVGSATVTAFAPNMNMSLCPSVIKNNALHDKIVEQSQRLIVKMSELDPSSSAYKAAADSFTQLTTVNAQLMKTYAGLEGATMQITFSTGMDQAYLDKYNLLNLSTVYNHVAFMPVPISEGFLSFTARNAAADDNSGAAVLASSVPGLSPNPAATPQNVILANGSVSGQVVLSLNGACPSVSEKDFANAMRAKPNLENLNAHLVANYTYSVPVKTVIGYKASLSIDTAVNSLFKYAETKGQFQVSDYIEAVQHGTVSNPFTFVSDGYETASAKAESEADKGFDQTLRNEVYTRMTTRMVERLKELGYLNVNEHERVRAPAAGPVAETAIRTVCRSTWFFGSSCRDEAYTITRMVSGSAEQIVAKLNDTKFTVSEDVTVNSVIQRTHTSTFAFKKEL